MKRSQFIGDRIQELHFGTILIGKLSFVMSLVSLVTVLSLKFDIELSPLMLVIIAILSFVMLWLTGWLCEKYGIRKHFMNAQLKNTFIDRGKDA